MKSFYEDQRLIFTFPSGTLVLVSASELLEGITEEDFLLVLALPVPDLHCWCSRPRSVTLETVFATTTGRRAA